LIRIRIDDDIPVTRGTTARLHSQGVTGLAYVMLDDDGSNADPLPAGADGLPRIALAPSMMDSLSEVAERFTKAFDDKALADMRRTLANTATASEGLKEMPQIMASLREALSDTNRKRLSNILAHLETTLGEAAPLTKEMRGLVASMQGVSDRLDRITDEGGTGSVARLNDLLDNLQRNSRQFDRVLQGIEEAPQSVVFGRQPPPPGPGETGYGAVAK
ncbi:MAG TPA: MCE family protein, partial [Rhodocyclaceae bacterium]